MNIELVWDEYRTLLKKFIRSKVSDPSDAEDLLQTILIKVHQNLHQLTDANKIRPWLMQISNHTIIDFYRKRAKERELTKSDLWYEQIEDNDDELAHCIQPFIEELPEKYRALLTDIELNGQEQKAYASDLGISYSTLKSRVQKGRKELKQVFDRCCTFDLDKNGKAIDWQPKAKNKGSIEESSNSCKHC